MALRIQSYRTASQIWFVLWNSLALALPTGAEKVHIVIVTDAVGGFSPQQYPCLQRHDGADMSATGGNVMYMLEGTEGAVVGLRMWIAGHAQCQLSDRLRVRGVLTNIRGTCAYCAGSTGDAP